MGYLLFWPFCLSGLTQSSGQTVSERVEEYVRQLWTMQIKLTSRVCWKFPVWSFMVYVFYTQVSQMLPLPLLCLYSCSTTGLLFHANNCQFLRNGMFKTINLSDVVVWNNNKSSSQLTDRLWSNMIINSDFQDFLFTAAVIYVIFILWFQCTDIKGTDTIQY